MSSAMLSWKNGKQTSAKGEDQETVSGDLLGFKRRSFSPPKGESAYMVTITSNRGRKNTILFYGATV